MCGTRRADPDGPDTQHRGFGRAGWVGREEAQSGKERGRHTGFKRIIPCLDVLGGRVVKGVNFVDFRDAGDPAGNAAFYEKAGADELVLLDITASTEGRDTMADVVRRVAGCISIPFTVGGGIRTCEDFDRIFKAGADKVSVNSAAVRRPEL